MHSQRGGASFLCMSAALVSCAFRCASGDPLYSAAFVTARMLPEWRMRGQAGTSVFRRVGQPPLADGMLQALSTAKGRFAMKMGVKLLSGMKMSTNQASEALETGEVALQSSVAVHVKTAFATQHPCAVPVSIQAEQAPAEWLLP